MAESRRGGRVLLIDAEGRVLLFRGVDPADPRSPYWFTVGGGAEPDETLRQAAARELFEETGLRADEAELGESVRSETVEFPYDGVVYAQRQDFFVLRVISHRVDVSGFEPIEAESIDSHRWWSVAELRSTDEQYYPEDLADFLESVLT